ncbi:peptide deformylase [Candidatus Gracilibacteria bacterium]|nr:peptide deformylase [Candidatus Gracilibacteria bacterium]MCF7819045.1 peptide deformylase [Candidatus Gracilibacteria bacterium]
MFDIVTGENQSILRTKCKPVEKFDEALEEIVREMTETMLAPQGKEKITGVGLAAPQVNIDARIILITLNVGTQKDHRILPMINPEILDLSEKKVLMEEGCLSLPGVFGKVSRPAKVQVRWQNLEGHWCEKKFDGWDARIFLHEYDHLEGILFIDYLQGHQVDRPTAL